MIRVTVMSGAYYGVELSGDTEKEMEQIEVFASEGTPVIIVGDLSDLEEMEIDPDSVQMVEREDE